MNYVLSANDVTFSEELLIVGNQCLQELCRCLQNHFAASCQDLVNFVIQQFDEPELFSSDHTLSVIKLLMQVRAGCLCNKEGCFLFQVGAYVCLVPTRDSGSQLRS